jgi:hypothetical protein
VKPIAAAVAGFLLFAAPAFARFQQPAAQASEAANPAEVQRLFDGYALVQAQQFLQLSDDQYARFLPRFMALQNARRQAVQQRNRVLNEIRLMTKPDGGTGTDDQIKAAMKQLQDVDDRGDAETRKALDGVDQTLDVRQQARFRVFEEQMERRKLELVSIARANRGNARGR